MRRHADPATKQALGCFVMLLLAGFMALGAMVLIPRAIGELVGANDPQRWHSILIRLVIWVVAPGAGIVVIARLTRGLTRGR